MRPTNDDPVPVFASALVDRLLADPPAVHVELGNPEGGVWRTDRDCYEFIAASVAPDARTLETGLGISTVLFLLLGAWHTCVTPFLSEASRLRAYCLDRGIPADRLQLIVDYSDNALPGLSGERDLVFVDGGHAFPIPMLDWRYAGGRLRRGGLVVVDDMHLPAVGVLCHYLDSDPRWQLRRRTVKWAAYERLSEGPLRDEWTDQPFYRP